MDKRERTQRQQQEDLVLNKVLFWCGGGAVLELLLMAVKRWNLSADGGAGVALKVLPFLALALGVAGAYWCGKNRKAGRQSVLPCALCVFFLALGLCSAVLWAYAPAVQILIYLVLVAVVLAILYYLYQREFFLVALLCSGGILGLWQVLRDGESARAYGVLAVVCALILAVAIGAFVLQKAGGVLTLGGKPRELLPKNANYVLVYVTCGLMAAVLIAALVVGSAVGITVYYAVPVAWLLIMAVYYTVKLM